eukprot:gene7506-15360_t
MLPLNLLIFATICSGFNALNVPLKTSRPKTYFPCNGPRLSYHTIPSFQHSLVQKKTVNTLYMSYGEDEKKNITPKTIITSLVLFLGVFGFGFLSPISSAIKDFAGKQQGKIEKVELKTNSGVANRGSLTKLTRREINVKLSQVPVFYATKGDDAVYTTDNIGYFFVDKRDADKYAESNNCKVIATAASDIYYTLIDKKTKLGSYIEGVSGKADPTATYKLVASSAQLKNVPQDWLDSHTDDVPLFRVPGLAFSKEEGLEVPLFLQKEDAIASFTRLQDAKKAQNPSNVAVDKPIEFQITSLKDLTGRFASGGFEGRALEIYPSMDDIVAAANLVPGQK